LHLISLIVKLIDTLLLSDVNVNVGV